MDYIQYRNINNYRHSVLGMGDYAKYQNQQEGKEMMEDIYANALLAEKEEMLNKLDNAIASIRRLGGSLNLSKDLLEVERFINNL